MPQPKGRQLDPAALEEVRALIGDRRRHLLIEHLHAIQDRFGALAARHLVALAEEMGLALAEIYEVATFYAHFDVARDEADVPPYPDYRSVSVPDEMAAFAAAWGVEALDTKPGLTVVEIMNTILTGDIRAMYIIGENPAMSDPDQRHAREALASLEHLVVQEIFLTETAFHADVILPASAFPKKTGSFTNTNRQVQLGRQVREGSRCLRVSRSCGGAAALPRAAQVVITASALANGALAGPLALCPRARVALVEPGAPLAPALFGLGVDVLSRLVVTGPEGPLRVVAESGSVARLKRTGRLVMLQRNMTPPGE